MNKIEIIDEENTISYEDRHSFRTFTFITDNKTFQYDYSVKDDVFYSTEVYKYKISLEPVEVYVRLIESYDEPPKEYSVKDGVVLEADLKKNSCLGISVEELKKEVKWHKLDLLIYSQSLFILSKHQEVISREEFRKYLRQTEQRIKNGLLHVQNYLDSQDSSGLKILTIDNETYIWFPNVTDENREELEKKYCSHRDDICNMLFNEESQDYSGITKNEFWASSIILSNIEHFLNKTEVVPVVDVKNTLANDNNYNSFSTIIIIVVLSWLLSLLINVDYNKIFIIILIAYLLQHIFKVYKYNNK